MSPILTVYVDTVDNYEDEIREDLMHDAFMSPKTCEHYMYKVVLNEDQVEIHDTCGRMVPISFEAMEEMAKAFYAIDSMIHKNTVMHREYSNWVEKLFNSMGGRAYVEG